MIRLDSATRKLEVLLGGVVATSQLPFVASWSDASSTGYAGGSTPGTSNDTATVDVVVAPASGVVRDVDYLSILNRDTFQAVVTFRLNDGGTPYELVSVTLAVGSQLIYTHADGWRVVDSTGSLKTGVTGEAGATGGVGAQGPATFLEAEVVEPDLLLVPGMPGTPGSTGATGTAGPAGPVMLPEECEDSGGIALVYAGAGASGSGNNFRGNQALGNNNLSEAKQILFNSEVDDGNSGTSKNIDWTTGFKRKLTLTGNVTLTFTAPSGVGMLQLKLVQDGTGGRTVTWPSVNYQGGSAPTIKATAAGVTIINIYYDGSAYWLMGSQF